MKPPPPAPAARSPRRWLVPAVIVLASWLVLGGLFCAQPILSGSLDLGDAIQLSLPMWRTWLAFAPMAVILAFLFPFEHGRWGRAILVHSAACLLVVFATQSFSGRSEGGGRPGFGGGPPPWVTGEVRSDHPERPERSDHIGPAGRRGGGRPGGPPMARVVLDVAIYAVLVSICQTVAWSRRAEERERRALAAEARLAEARLAALRMQLNPHFLFNALNGLSTLIHTDPKKADSMLGDLGDLLRAALETAEDPVVPLRRELDFLRRYLAIEETRFGDRLRVAFAVDSALLEALVPPFLLQPLVENAVRHGIEPQASPGLIRIEANREGKNLRLVVSDNGKGFEARPAPSSGHGIGLANTRARLEQMFPGEHEFPLAGGEGGGCVAIITIPCRTADLSADQAS